MPQLPGANDVAGQPSAGWTIGQCASLACLLEATAPKPGNVHRGADFEDVTYPEFIASGIAIAPVLERASEVPLGATVLAAVQASRQVSATNTHLGTILLLAPLAAVPRGEPLTAGVRRVLAGLSPQDARDVYAAIRLARPGGLGQVAEADVNSSAAPEDLLAAMRLAAERDLVARQYAENFRQVFDCVVPWLSQAFAELGNLDAAIVHVQLRLIERLSRQPDFPQVLGRHARPQRGLGRAYPGRRTARQRSLPAAAGRFRFLASFGRPPAEPGHDRRSDRRGPVRPPAGRPAPPAALRPGRWDRLLEHGRMSRLGRLGLA